MDKKRRILNKHLLLALILIAVFVLPGCRTRITNNSEVSNIQYDEDGYLTETYQMRRDELGLSTAERPILPDFGSGETDDNDDFSEGESIDYNPEDFQEDFTEPETTTNTNTNTNTNTGTTPRSTTRRTTNTTPSRRSTTTNDTYTVTFKGNGGTPSTQTRTFPKTNPKKITFPTQPKRKGYEFNGWWTNSDDGKGSQVDTSMVVKANTILYAHWKESGGSQDKDEEYNTITFDVDGGDSISPITVKKGTDKALPTPKKEGYDFEYWDDGSNTYAGGQVISVNSNIKLTAVWKEKPETHWKKEFDTAKTDASTTPNCIKIGEDGDSGIVQDCKTTFKSDEDYSIVVKFAKSADVKKTLEDLKAEENEDGSKKYAGKKLIVISTAAEKSKNKLAYQIALMNIIHGSGMDEGQAAADLLGDEGEVIIESFDL